MFKNFKEMAEKVKASPQTKKIVVVCAHDAHTLEGVSLACQEKIARPILIGDAAKIEELSAEHNCKLDGAEIINNTDDVAAAKEAVSLIREGRGDFLMKGKMQTADLLREVVNKETGLQTGSIMSHVGLFEVPNYHKVVVLTDGGMLPHPTLEQKVHIINNAVKALRNMGYEKPKVGVLAAAEVVNKKAVESVEAETLKEMCEKGEIADCIIEGPISYDLAFSTEMADFKGYKSPVAGDVDIVLMPTMAAGNILGKSWYITAGGAMAGVIAGAKAPVVLVSRGASAEEKYYSIALAAAASSPPSATQS